LVTPLPPVFDEAGGAPGRQDQVVVRGSEVRPARRHNRAARLAGLGAGGTALLILLAGCDVGEAFGGFGVPKAVSDQGEKIYDLWIGSMIAALAVGLFVWGLIFWCIIRYRRRGDELPVQTRFNMPMEFLYTITPILIVSVLFYYMAVVQTDVDKVSKNPDLTVEVVAFKWNWQFNYRDGIGPEANTVASTLGSSDVIPVLVVPVGKKVRIEQTSRDVIHSFWVPELLFKRDVFPGEKARNVFEVTVNSPGAYVGRCAELCGTYHAMMNFEVRAVEPEKFDQFLAAKIEGKSTQEALAMIGEEPLAVTTSPFPTKRDANNFNPSDPSAGR